MATTLGFAQNPNFSSYAEYLKQMNGGKTPIAPVPGGQQFTDPSQVQPGQSFGNDVVLVPEGGQYGPGGGMTTPPPREPEVVNTSGGPFSQDTINQNLQGQGFGQRPAPFTAPTITSTPGAASAPGGFSGSAQGMMPTAGTVAPPPRITAPTVQAEQGGFADFDALQREIFESTYRPAEREINLQRGQADERLNSALAKAGLSASGSGIGQRVRQDQEYSRQVAAAAQDASHQAAVQRYGMEYTQEMDNARLRQETNLANAGFSLTAQVENAKNLLTANITNAQLQTQASIAGAANQTQAGIANTQAQAQIAAANIGAQSAQAVANAQIASAQALANAQLQVQTMGLSLEAEQSARRDYLTLLGIQEADLARMDNFELETTAMFYDTYLKQLAILSGAGSVSSGKVDQSSSSLKISPKIEI